MLPGPDLVKACPACGRLIRQKTLMSGNTFGALTWTDGYQVAPMLPSYPSMVKCNCGNFFWLEDVESVGEIPFSARDVPEEWEAAPEATKLSLNEYREALSMGVGTSPEKERYLRVKLWWKINDKRRQNPLEVPPEYQSLFRENLERLLEILSAESPGQKIMNAEILRELGRFEESIELLKTITENEFAEYIKSLAEKEDKFVHRFESD
jgi:hypothetical protein